MKRATIPPPSQPSCCSSASRPSNNDSQRPTYRGPVGVTRRPDVFFLLPSWHADANVNFIIYYLFRFSQRVGGRVRRALVRNPGLSCITTPCCLGHGLGGKGGCVGASIGLWPCGYLCLVASWKLKGRFSFYCLLFIFYFFSFLLLQVDFRMW